MIKLIDILKEITEGKQVGTLYHNTNIKKAIQIIKTNKLKINLDTGHIFIDYRNKPEDFIFMMGNPVHKNYLEGKIKAFISFTRNKNYRRVEDNVQFVLDGDKLSENYKISPYSQFGGRSYDEMEERIYKDITNLNKYIIKIILPNSNPEIESLLKEKNIPYELNLNESLHDWFKKEDWVRIDTQGNITGPCGTMKKGKKTTRCLPRAKANSLTKAERAATSQKKAASDKQFVPNTKKAKVKLTELRQIIYNIINESLHLNEDNIDEYDVESSQDVKEFVQFMREYKQPLHEAEYHGRKVQLGKPMQGDVKKFKVYVKNPKGKVVKVNFGFGGSSAKGKRMNIKKNNPKRRKAFRARHNCDSPGPRTKARYWSCRKW
jgi:hypothetical protein